MLCLYHIHTWYIPNHLFLLTPPAPPGSVHRKLGGIDPCWSLPLGEVPAPGKYPETLLKIYAFQRSF